MSTTITIALPASVAELYENASPEQQQKVAELLPQYIADVLHNETLMAVVREISSEAVFRGLTQELLDEILSDDD